MQKAVFLIWSEEDFMRNDVGLILVGSATVDDVGEVLCGNIVVEYEVVNPVGFHGARMIFSKKPAYVIYAFEIGEDLLLKKRSGGFCIPNV